MPIRQNKIFNQRWNCLDKGSIKTVLEAKVSIQIVNWSTLSKFCGVYVIAETIEFLFHK